MSRVAERPLQPQATCEAGKPTLVTSANLPFLFLLGPLCPVACCLRPQHPRDEGSQGAVTSSGTGGRRGLRGPRPCLHSHAAAARSDQALTLQLADLHAVPS